MCLISEYSVWRNRGIHHCLSITAQDASDMQRCPHSVHLSLTRMCLRWASCRTGAAQTEGLATKRLGTHYRVSLRLYSQTQLNNIYHDITFLVRVCT